MLKSNNGNAKNTTVTKVLTSEDEPCGKDTNFKYNYKPNAAQE